MPERIQLSRAKGWRKPEGAVSVVRPTKWGNPYRVEDLLEWYSDDLGYTDWQRREMAVSDFRGMVYNSLRVGGRDTHDYASLEEIASELRGHDLACWCPLDQPCHADVLLELANAPAAPESEDAK